MKLIRHAQYTHREYGELAIDQDLRDALAAMYGEDLTLADVHYVFELMRSGLINWSDGQYDTDQELLDLVGPEVFAIIEQEHAFLIHETDHNYIVFFGILETVNDWLWSDMDEVEESSEMDWYSDECDTSDEVVESEVTDDETVDED